MAATTAHLDFACVSDVGKRRLANEDAVYCEEAFGLFVVCDGIGGQPSGEAASQIIAHSLGHLIRRRLRELDQLSHDLLCDVLTEAAVDLSAELVHHARRIPSLKGMGATLVSALIDQDNAFILYAGDSRAYLLRGNNLAMLTQDHSQNLRKLDTDESGDGLIDRGEARLLTQFIGMGKKLTPQVRSFTMQPGDRLLLCTDGLTDPVDRQTLGQLLRRRRKPAQACDALLKAALTSGGKDNITMIVLDYLGQRQRRTQPRAKEKSANQTPPRGLAQQIYNQLRLLEADLHWLHEGAIECATLPHLSAIAAVKRRLGREEYTAFLKLHPSRNPAHVFHRACTIVTSPWRQRYEQHIAAIEPLIDVMTEHDSRLSPLLNEEETSLILRTLWQGWRRVEKRYFTSCQRDAIHETEQTLNILIEHMYKSVQTMMGLLELFPRFMRETKNK